MKILQIAPPWANTPPDGYGGTELVIANLIKGLATYGHDVSLFATKRSKGVTKSFHIFEEGLLNQNIRWEAALPSIIHYHQAFSKADQFDIVHAHLSSQTDLSLLPFLADLTEKGIPNVVTLHSRQPYDRFSAMDSHYFKQYGTKITAIGISKTMLKDIPKNFTKAGFVYNSLDTTKMRFKSRPGTYLTWLGQIIPVKGLHEAIMVAKKSGEQLVFAGIVDTMQKISVEYFEKKVKPFIDGKQIVYLGPADLKMKNKLLGGAKAFLNPIDWEEPFGMVMVESMACGTPVVSFARGAAPEIVIDGKTGFLVKNNNQMLKAIKKLDSINRSFCRKYVEMKFSPEVAAKEFLTIYKKQILQTKKLSYTLTKQRYEAVSFSDSF